ncbi:YlmC/YmxH family sporulation protein [Natribacillus halophilus]|uniref:Sporulation protein, YlmC/YmxH family n=1 Tax=Natribacillus halophilus TaxID=549003 RepID=A0A1G8PQV3_9BACI|nr:YlmC/YmxH family sporulation protein [Natribacillus halophilus]SDI94901.1 sporulation protein, YlmC/YmxH family [Natribacillus halophilus]
MRLSEMSAKEIVDFEQGERLGVPGRLDARVNASTGEIEAFLFPTSRWSPFRKNEETLEIRWHHIHTIGEDMIIVNRSV